MSVSIEELWCVHLCAHFQALPKKKKSEAETCMCTVCVYCTSKQTILQIENGHKYACVLCSVLVHGVKAGETQQEEN